MPLGNPNKKTIASYLLTILQLNRHQHWIQSYKFITFEDFFRVSSQEQKICLPD